MYFFTRTSWLATLGSTLLNSLWQMAMLWLVYMLITGMNRRFSAAVRHGLAIVFLSIGSGWFIFSLIRAQLYPGDPATGLASIILNPDTSLASLFYTCRRWLDNSLPYLSFAWLAAVLFMLMRHALYYRRLQSMRSTGLQRISPRVKLFTTTTASHMGIRKKVMVWLSEAVDTPVTIGFFKPIILIPLATINHLTMEQVEAVLLHELSHIRRNDYLINLFITWAGIVFFFNPFCRLLIRVIRNEREHCCDDLVLQFQYNPQDYAQALLSLEKKRQQTVNLALAAIGKSQPLLLERVKRLTGQPDAGRRYSITMILFLFFSMLLGFGSIVKQRQIIGLVTLKTSPVKGLYPEVITVKYVTPSPGSEPKTIKIIKKNRKINLADNQTPEEETNVSFAGNIEPEAGADIAPAVNSENRDYSIITSVDPALSALSADPDLPYVPSTSYFYQVQDDTIPKTNLSEQGEVFSAQANSVRVMKQLNWTKIEKKIAKNKKLAIADLQKEVQLSMDNSRTGGSIDLQTSILLSEADQKRLKESIDLNVDAYNNEKVKYSERARTLQRKIREGQLRLKEDYLRKQLQSVQKAQQQMRKAAKVVYI